MKYLYGVEHKACRLIDGNCTRIGCRIDDLTGVQLQGFKVRLSEREMSGDRGKDAEITTCRMGSGAGEEPLLRKSKYVNGSWTVRQPVKMGGGGRGT
jgi:hypothetical protein